MYITLVIQKVKTLADINIIVITKQQIQNNSVITNNFCISVGMIKFVNSEHSMSADVLVNDAYPQKIVT